LFLFRAPASDLIFDSSESMPTAAASAKPAGPKYSEIVKEVRTNVLTGSYARA
jgi:hypothetical protein